MLVFLTLVVSNLFFIYSKELMSFSGFNAETNSLVKIENINNICGLDSTRGIIEKYDSDYTLNYSINGGSSFQELQNNNLHFDEIENPIIIYYPTSFHWLRPNGNLPQIKTVVLNANHESRGIKTNTKYITYLGEVKHTIPVLSVIMKEEDIVGEKNGIMVMGVESWNNEGFYKNWWDKNANFTRRGSKSTKEVYVHYFENNELSYEGDLNLKISGNATRGFPQKSMQIFADNSTSHSKINYPFFGKEGLTKYQSLFIRNSGNDNTRTMFADLFMHSLAKESNVVSQIGQPIQVYLNGNYWGLYNLRERIDLYYLSKIEDCKETEITVLENDGNKLKEGKKKELEKFTEIIENLKNDVLKESEFLDFFDVDNVMDYFIFETFFANTDWPNNNVILFKSDEGKWKFALHDLDYGLAYLGADAFKINVFDKLKKSKINTAAIFQFILSTDNLKRQFISRAYRLLETILSYENMISVFTEFQSTIQIEIELEINRWRLIDNLSTWKIHCESNIEFLQKREEEYIKQLEGL